MRNARLLAAAVATATLLMASVAHAAAQLRFVNNTDVYLTLSLNGLYGCNTAPGTTCSIPIAPGDYQLRACAADGRCVGQSAHIPDGATFTYTVTSD